MSAPDKPQNVDLVLSNLKREVEEKRPEPLGIRLPSSKRIEFKYPLVYKRTERNQWIELIADALRKNDDEPLLERMLSPEDKALYDAEDLDDDVHMAVLGAVSEHFDFEGKLKTEGKEPGSDLL